MVIESLRVSLEPHKNGRNGHYLPHPIHYPHGYRWDEAEVSMGNTATGDIQNAVAGLEEVLSWQNPETGFIPNIKFTPKRRIDPERYTFKRPNVESDYPQPPLEPKAAKAIYDKCVSEGNLEYGEIVLRKNYPALKLGTRYFSDKLENNNSPLIGVPHPSATGRDSGPDTDSARPGRIPTFGPKTPGIIYSANTVIDYASSLFLNLRLRLADWDPEKTRKIFWMTDVMFNCIYAKSLDAMSDIAKTLGEEKDMVDFSQKAETVSNAILNELWDDNTGYFHSLDKNGEPIPEITISNLYGITLSNIDAEKTRRIIDVMNDADEFKTRYPFSSVQVKSKHYDPHRREKRLWRGGNFLNATLHLIEGLELQYFRFLHSNPKLSKDARDTASFAAKGVVEMVEREGFWECFDPEKGDGQRLQPFAWSKAVYYTLKAKYAHLLSS